MLDCKKKSIIKLDPLEMGIQKITIHNDLKTSKMSWKTTLVLNDEHALATIMFLPSSFHINEIVIPYKEYFPKFCLIVEITKQHMRWRIKVWGGSFKGDQDYIYLVMYHK